MKDLILTSQMTFIYALKDLEISKRLSLIMNDHESIEESPTLNFCFAGQDTYK